MEPTNKLARTSEVPACPRFVRNCGRQATHIRGTKVSQLPDWICRRRAKGSACRRHRSGEAWGPARLGAVIAPRRCRYRHIIRSNRPVLCHASRARKWRREPLISYPCGAATHRRTLEPALILGGQGAIRGRAGGGAGREGMIHDPAWHSYDHGRGAAAASADGDRYGCGPQPLGHVLRGLRRTVRGAAFVPLSQSEPKLLRPLQRVQESLPHELSPIGAAAR